jgi:hypothetical protein
MIRAVNALARSMSKLQRCLSPEALSHLLQAPALFLGLAGLALAGCAGARPEPAQPTAAPAAPPAAAVPVAAPSRVLPQHATFADVVDLARNLDAANHTQSQEGCLLAVGPAARFGADVSAATRPLADAPKELATLLLRAAGPPTIFTAWGSTPGELPDIALAAFTTTTPASAKASALAMFLTSQGVFLRGAQLPLRAHPDALDLGAAGAVLAQVPDPVIAYVSAESAIPVEQLAAALRSVPNRFEVALAVVLPKGTRLPAVAERSQELLCPDGLPEPQSDEPEGSLDPAALRAELTPLRDAALRCALATGGQALQGGRLELGLRIGADGRPRELCIVRDAIGEAVLRRCVIEAARALKFPLPSPTGFVDVQLPLELALTGPAAQRPLCE